MSTVFTIERPRAKAILMPQPNDDSMYDPDLFRAAVEIYNFYCQTNPDRERRRQPIGVAMNKRSHRGKLIFSSFPILLPDECFISVQQLEGEAS